MIRIRYHHLMCISRYEGKGYSEEFCKNLESIISRMKTEKYVLIDTCDDICSACPNMTDGVCRDNEKVLRYDRAVQSAVASGQKPIPHYICPDCQWFSLCSKK